MTNSVLEFCKHNLLITSPMSYDKDDHCPVDDAFAAWKRQYPKSNLTRQGFTQLVYDKYNSIEMTEIDGKECFNGLRLEEIDIDNSLNMTIKMSCKVDKKDYFETIKDARIIGHKDNNCKLQVSFAGYWRDITKGTMEFCLGYMHGHYGIVTEMNGQSIGITYYQ